MSKKVSVEVVSDVICPWCFLGKRRLDKAIAQLPDVEVEVTYRPFFLDSSIPAEGIDRHEYMVAKFGEERLATLHDPLIKAGKEDDVPYNFDKVTRTPNTLNAHRLLNWARADNVQGKVKEALMLAYWRDGKDISDLDVLIDIAKACGMDSEKAACDLESDRDAKLIATEVLSAQSMGITGVPTFILNQKYGVVGAQSAETLAEAIRQVAASIV
jgi:predicted DsbA family dithiol-disulfide isomerase